MLHTAKLLPHIYFYDADTGLKIKSIDVPESAYDRFTQTTLAVSDQYLIVSACGRHGQETAYVFDISTGDLVSTLLEPAEGAYQSNSFGWAIAVYGDTVAVGTYGGGGSRSVYLYQASTGEFKRKIISPHSNTNDTFGSNLELTGNILIVSAFNAEYEGANRGEVYLFDAANGDLLTTLDRAENSHRRGFGFSIDILGETIAVTSLGIKGPTPDYYTPSDFAYLYDFSGNLIQTFVDRVAVYRDPEPPQPPEPIAIAPPVVIPPEPDLVDPPIVVPPQPDVIAPPTIDPPIEPITVEPPPVSVVIDNPLQIPGLVISPDEPPMQFMPWPDQTVVWPIDFPGVQLINFPGDMTEILLPITTGIGYLPIIETVDWLPIADITGNSPILFVNAYLVDSQSSTILPESTVAPASAATFNSLGAAYNLVVSSAHASNANLFASEDAANAAPFVADTNTATDRQLGDAPSNFDGSETPAESLIRSLRWGKKAPAAQADAFENYFAALGEDA